MAWLRGRARKIEDLESDRDAEEPKRIEHLVAATDTVKSASPVVHIGGPIESPDDPSDAEEDLKLDLQPVVDIPFDPKVARGEQLRPASDAAITYGDKCTKAIAAYGKVIETVNYANSAREMATRSNEIGRENLLRDASRYDREFVSLYKDFLATCVAAREAGNAYWFECETADVTDPDYFLNAVARKTYSSCATFVHVARHDFPAAHRPFMSTAESVNEAIQADIARPGEPGFVSAVYHDLVDEDLSMAPVSSDEFSTVPETSDPESAWRLTQMTLDEVREWTLTVLSDKFDRVSLNDYGNVMVTLPGGRVFCKPIEGSNNRVFLTIDTPVLLDVPETADLYELLAISAPSFPFGALICGAGGEEGKISIGFGTKLIADCLPPDIFFSLLNSYWQSRSGRWQRFNR